MGGDTLVDSPWQSVTTPDPSREYLALLSYLPLKGYRKLLDLMRRSRQVSAQLETTPGVIGFTVRAKLVRHRFWTLSVWENETALQAFVRKSPHLDAMEALRTRMDETAFTRWTVKAATCRCPGRTRCATLRPGAPRGRSPATCTPR